MVISIVLLISVLIRLLIGQWGYSGQGHPPMFGDFEAQRHWMEVTLELNVGDWYKQTQKNDLLYWGLDYPPLTAYVSYAFGIVASYWYPPLVSWMVSRGHESVLGKLFMRLSVVFSDIVIFIPAVIQSFPLVSNRSLFMITSYQILTLLLLINAPALLLIDHGHFQYNGVCLGFALMGSFCVALNYDIWGSVFYCLSLNFKQMSLYFAPVFFISLLRKCFIQKSIIGNIGKFVSLGVTVLTTFGILWAPFCIYPSAGETCVSSLLHVLSRQFPFSRGIFEDKVSNIWFSLSVFIDVRQYWDQPTLIKCSLALTVVLLSPVIAFLLYKPIDSSSATKSLVASALSFFLASFQVHEKSILLAAVPSLLLLESDGLFCIWFQVASCFSMFPLLVRDGLRIPYWSSITLFLTAYAIHNFIFSTLKEGANDEPVSSNTWSIISISSFLSFLVGVSVLGMVLLHSLELLVVPPLRYPDIYPVLFALFSTCMFCGAYIYIVMRLWYPKKVLKRQQQQKTAGPEKVIKKEEKSKAD